MDPKQDISSPWAAEVSKTPTAEAPLGQGGILDAAAKSSQPKKQGVQPAKSPPHPGTQILPPQPGLGSSTAAILDDNASLMTLSRCQPLSPLANPGHEALSPLCSPSYLSLPYLLTLDFSWRLPNPALSPGDLGGATGLVLTLWHRGRFGDFPDVI